MSDSRGPRWTVAQSLWLGLLLCVLQCTEICIASGKMSSLKRTQGEDVLFLPDSKFENETLSIKWYFQSKNLHLLTIWSGESIPHWIIPQKEYKGRLSAPYGKSLRITNLTPEDSGDYEAHIMSVSGDIYIAKFNLTVLGTVTTESNKNPLIQWLPAVILAFVMLLLGPVLYKVKKSAGIFTRENTQAVMHLRDDERRLENGLTAFPDDFHSEQETN